MNRNWKVFLDANIYIAGLASSKGPSGRILQLARNGCLKIYSSKFILSEVERNLKKKLPKILEFFYRDLVEIDLKIVYKIPRTKRKEFETIVNYKPDALVLAACDIAKVDILVTLDKKHLLQDKVKKAVNFKILRPEEFEKLLVK